MNLQQMKKKVYDALRDSEKAFIEDSSVEDWLNEAYQDVASRLRLTRIETTGTTTASGTITLPTDYVEAVWLSIVPEGSTDQVVVEFVDDAVFDSWRLAGSTPHNQLARIFDGTIETYPVAASESYTLRYVYRPTVMDSAADTPDLPEELHMRLVHYARAHAKFIEGELEEGDRYMSMYESGLPMPNMAGYRERPGPFSLRPAPGWWDE